MLLSVTNLLYNLLTEYHQISSCITSILNANSIDELLRSKLWAEVANFENDTENILVTISRYTLLV